MSEPPPPPPLRLPRQPALERVLLARSAASALLAVALSGTLLRSLPLRVTRLLPVCPIHQATGLLCPGCGTTRALLALAHGHFAAAWHANALCLVLLPLAFLYSVRLLQGVARPQEGLRRLSPHPLALAALLAVAGLFTVARNLPL